MWDGTRQRTLSYILCKNAVVLRGQMLVENENKRVWWTMEKPVGPISWVDETMSAFACVKPCHVAGPAVSRR